MNACEETITALRRVAGELSEEDRTSLSLGLGGKLQSRAAQVACYRAEAKIEGQNRSPSSVTVVQEIAYNVYV